MPPPPAGNLCLFNAQKLYSVCEPISPQMVQEDKTNHNLTVVLNGKNGIIIPAVYMNNWITTDPNTWANMQAYINQLKSRAQQCIGP
jgi:hypothetical protein